MLKHTFILLGSFLLCSANINRTSSEFGKVAVVGDKDNYFDNSGACFLKGTCQPLQNATCFGTPMPYTHFSVDLAKDSRSLSEVQSNLASLRFVVPHCWAVIQPLLCAVYMPKCENDSIYLPSQEMCSITRGPCKTVAVEQGWPSFLQCNNKTLFPSHCRNPWQEIKYNTSSKCISPLVETDNPDNWFHDVKGCGIQCRNPLYTAKDHFKTHNFLNFIVFISLLTTTFTLITFIGGWKKLDRYPEKIIFYINICWTLALYGWSVQFFRGAREKIACGDDGTVRRLQLGSGISLCEVTFVLIYFFTIAALVWFVFLTYAWCSVFSERGSKEDFLQKEKTYFHIYAWSIPFILTNIAIRIAEVEGDFMTGICFVGFSNINMRINFVLIPVLLAFLSGGYFVTLTLFKLKRMVNSETVATHHTMLSYGLFALCLVGLVCITFLSHAFDFINRQEWDESFKDYVKCLAMSSGQSSLSGGESSYTECVLESKPDVLVLCMHLLCLFLFGAMFSSLFWIESTLKIWKSLLFCGE